MAADRHGAGAVVESSHLETTPNTSRTIPPTGNQVFKQVSLWGPFSLVTTATNCKYELLR